MTLKNYIPFDDKKNYQPLCVAQQKFITQSIVERLRRADIFYQINKVEIFTALKLLMQMGYQYEIYIILLPQIHHSTIKFSEFEELINDTFEPSPSTTLGALLVALEQINDSQWKYLDEIINSDSQCKIKINIMKQKLLWKLKQCKLKN